MPSSWWRRGIRALVGVSLVFIAYLWVRSVLAAIQGAALAHYAGEFVAEQATILEPHLAKKYGLRGSGGTQCRLFLGVGCVGEIRIDTHISLLESAVDLSKVVGIFRNPCQYLQAVENAMPSSDAGEQDIGKLQEAISRTKKYAECNGSNATSPATDVQASRPRVFLYLYEGQRAEFAEDKVRTIIEFR